MWSCPTWLPPPQATRALTICASWHCARPAAYFAFDVLEEGGTFVAKVLAGGAENELQALLKRAFAKVANVKPPASRADSSEKFVVATGFRGVPEEERRDH